MFGLNFVAELKPPLFEYFDLGSKRKWCFRVFHAGTPFMLTV